jgi:hypothetical protein
MAFYIRDEDAIPIRLKAPDTAPVIAGHSTSNLVVYAQQWRSNVIQVT